MGREDVRWQCGIGNICSRPGVWMGQNFRNLREFFENIYNIYVDIKGKKLDNINMNILSMGMSGDYEQAILCGSNLVRIGSSIFGPRIY